ncbi:MULTISPECIES: molecular chaperone DnaJ [Acinetobacter]|uniref:molecular chaperone DnaJ n=1 Tax=Acinetobacter TaxID=469 RepID=UPI000993AA33|nr:MULTISPECIES: molecular chaperone DnaJ [Acinetobacter]MCL6244924.1 molecular chaperone DnaJ [Acinetobacter amyesii]OOV84147.1 molecular chaperone DnaJ [Acinetobacter sp. ANC 5600]
MSFELKVSLLPSAEALSPQHKKLNKLIEQIEQQKLDLALWQNAKSEIQSYIQLKLVPIYGDLHAVYYRQLAQLWHHIQQEDFAKADLAQLDAKLAKLAKQLKKSNYLNTAELEKVAEVDAFYQQHHAHNLKSNKKAKSAQAEQSKVEGHVDIEQETEEEYESYEEWDSEQYQREKEEHQRKRLAQKREQAEKLVNQSLKTVYLKITAMIHPDREPDETKKTEKTELLQVVNQAHEAQDLFYLLKLQLQLETNKGKSPKALTDEHLKFYKMALEAQSQRLVSQIDDITDSFHWSEKPKPKNMQVKDVYKVIDGDVSVLKEQVRWEKERLKYMEKVKGLEVLLENGVL